MKNKLTLLLLTYHTTFAQIAFQENIISDTLSSAREVYAVDLDGDNDLDIIAASRNDDKVVWYENTDGFGNFGQEQIISSETDYPICQTLSGKLLWSNHVELVSINNDKKKLKLVLEMTF